MSAESLIIPPSTYVTQRQGTLCKLSRARRLSQKHIRLGLADPRWRGVIEQDNFSEQYTSPFYPPVRCRDVFNLTSKVRSQV